MRDIFKKQLYSRLSRSKSKPEEAVSLVYGSVIKNSLKKYEEKAWQEFARDLYEVLKLLHKRKPIDRARKLTERILGRYWCQYLKSKESRWQSDWKQVHTIIKTLCWSAIEEDNPEVFESLLAGPQEIIVYELVHEIRKARAVSCAEVVSRKWKRSGIRSVLELIMDDSFPDSVFASVENAKIDQALMASQSDQFWVDHFKRISACTDGYKLRILECICDSKNNFPRLVELVQSRNCDPMEIVSAYESLRSVLMPTEAVNAVFQAFQPRRNSCRV